MKPVDLKLHWTKSDSSSSAGSAVINLVSTPFRKSQQFFRMVHRILAEEFLSNSIQLIIITTVLGWNSHQVSIFLLYYNQQTRYTINVGSEPAICHLQVDILSYNLHTSSLQLSNEQTWHRHYIRPKPPWLYIFNIYLAFYRLLRVISGFFPLSGKMIFIYPSLSHRLGRFRWLFQHNQQLSTNSSHIVKLSDSITIYSLSLSDYSSNNWRKFDDHGPPALSQASYTQFFGMNSSSWRSQFV